MPGIDYVRGNYIKYDNLSNERAIKWQVLILTGIVFANVDIRKMMLKNQHAKCNAREFKVIYSNTFINIMHNAFNILSLIKTVKCI